MAWNAEGGGEGRWHAAEPLAGYRRVFTRNVDEAADAVGRIFCPHRLAPAGTVESGFFARHHCAALDGFSINYVAYGGTVTIDPGCLDRFFLLQVPCAGEASIATAARVVETSPGRTASLLSPTRPTRMEWRGDCAQIIVLVDRGRLEQRAAALAGQPRQVVEFDPAVDLRGAWGQLMLRQLRLLVDALDRPPPGRRCRALPSPMPARRCCRCC